MTTTNWRITGALAMAVAVALSGCGRDPAAESAAPVEAEAIADGPATGRVDVWAMGAEGEALGEFAAAFEQANPGVDVVVTPVPWDAAHDKIATAIAAGQTPDVSLIGSTWMGEFAKAGGLEPTPQGLIEEAEFFPGPWGSTVVDGTSYGAPWYAETRVLYYRTDLAQQAGWDAAPKSWDELKSFARDLESRAGVEYGLNIQPGQTGSWQTFLPFAWSNGAQLVDGTQYAIDSPETVEALEYYKSFVDEGLSSTRILTGSELEQGFAAGTYGAFVSGPWHMELIEDVGAPYSVAPLPSTDGTGIGTSFVGGGNLGVFTGTDNRDASWKFVDWLTEPAQQQAWYDVVGALPSVPQAWETGALADDARLAVFGRQLENAQSPPTTPTWEEVSAVIDSETEKAVLGAVPVPQAVTTMQQQAQSIGVGS